ncbi:uncharacterized protein LOC134430642 isoform X2 [Melospiza melodia melodia]|uniref:uncharacterized protein LOC134430642 isoform X2 n=1 Tax=Melospiza melodia melodia TaxID=1914991 RepID=UPI002FD09689
MDLEDFNTKIFFELLLRQSQSVTTTLGHFKEEVRAVYHRAMNEISLLKNLWLKALSTPAKGEEEEEEEEEESTEAQEQVPLSGSPRAFGSPRFRGISEIPNDPREFIPQKLIPLLQSVLQLLQENRKFNLSPESPESHNKWLMKKNQNFLHVLSSGRHSLAQRAHPGEEIVNSLSPSELEDKVDALTQELLQIAEDEEQFLNSKGNEDLLSYYLEITSLEKESLAKQINALEEEIAQGRKV